MEWNTKWNMGMEYEMEYGSGMGLGQRNVSPGMGSVGLVATHTQRRLACAKPAKRVLVKLIRVAIWVQAVEAAAPRLTMDEYSDEPTWTSARVRHEAPLSLLS